MVRGNVLIIMISVLLGCKAEAQVINVDRELLEDSLLKEWEIVLSGTLSSDKQKSNLLEANINSEIVRNLATKNMVFMVFRNNLTFLGNDRIQNEGMLHFRFRDRDTRKVSPEFFSQYQWNGIWQMQYRLLLGGNIRFRILEKSGVDLYSGTGFFREWEKWGRREMIERSIWRWNNYLKLSVKVSSVLDFSSIAYLQFPLSRQFGAPRWYQEANAYLSLGKRLVMVFHWDHIWDQTTLLPIDPFFYSFSTGVQLNF